MQAQALFLCRLAFCLCMSGQSKMTQPISFSSARSLFLKTIDSHLRLHVRTEQFRICNVFWTETDSGIRDFNAHDDHIFLRHGRRSRI